MKIKYRDNTLKPNTSSGCIDCDIYKYADINICIILCGKKETFGRFKIIDDCEVLEL